MHPIQVKVLEPIGFPDNAWIDGLQGELPIHIETLDSRLLSDEELIALLPEAEALLLSNRPLTQKVLQSLPKLKFISVAFAGLDHIDMIEAKKRGIIVKNAAGYASRSVSELVIGLSLQLYRRIAESSLTLSKAELLPFPLGKELFGKKVGIIGGGATGKATGNLFTAFGCEVFYFNRKNSNLEELLKTSDIISLHLPLTEETKNFIDGKRLALMKPSAILINTARGPIVDQEALSWALTHKKLAGAAFDVFDKEPPLSPGHLLLQTPHFFPTPHIGYRTEEAMLQKASLAVAHLKNWITSLQNT